MTKCVLKTQTENMYPYHSTIFDRSTPIGQNMWDILKKILFGCL